MIVGAAPPGLTLISTLGSSGAVFLFLQAVFRLDFIGELVYLCIS